MDKTTNYNIALVGNGLLRAFENGSCSSWISKMANENGVSYSENELNLITFPQRVVVASKDHVDREVKKYAEEIKGLPNTEKQNLLYKNLLSLNMDAFLTTNYSFELEKSVYGGFNPNLHWKKRVYTKDKTTKKEKNSSIYEYICLDDTGNKKLFHIHGDAHRPNSMIIGHYYYGKLLAEIQKNIPITLKNQKTAQKVGFQYKPRNWIDYFMVSNIYILGFKLDLSEMDLWWLICCKKRNAPETNIYFYEPEKDIDIEKRMLLEAYGVKIESVNLKVKNNKGLYQDYYEDVIRDIRGKINA